MLGNIIAIEFGKVLRRIRQEHGLTQEKLGFESGLQRNFISMLENGERQPTITSIFKLSQALKIDASRLIKLVETELGNAGR